SGGMHGSNRLGGNSLSDLLVFGRRAGLGAADYVRALSSRPAVSPELLDAAAKRALSPFDGPKDGSPAENPHKLQIGLQDGMNANWRNTLLVCRASDNAASDASVPHISISRKTQVPMRPDLLELFEIAELEKYYTDEELAEHPGRRTP